MKFVHIADLHLDRPFVSLKSNKDLAKKRRLEQKFAFKKVIDYIKQNKIDILFASGDLFEQKYVTEDTILYLISSFKEIKDTKVYITPGNHDPLVKTSPYNIYEWPKNVFIFGGEVGKDTINNIDIYGLGFDDFIFESKAIKDIVLDENKTNILITHGTLNGASKTYHDIKEEWLKKFNYVALGHIHMPKVDNSKIIYPGSLTSCGFDEPGDHGMVVGEILPNGEVDYEFIKVDDTKFEKKTVDISKLTSSQEVIDKLDLQNDTIYKIELNGTKSFDTKDIEEQLKIINKNVCEVEDNSNFDYNLEEISKEESLRGIFTRNVLEEINKNPTEKEKYLRSVRIRV